MTTQSLSTWTWHIIFQMTEGGSSEPNNTVKKSKSLLLSHSISFGWISQRVLQCKMLCHHSLPIIVNWHIIICNHHHLLDSTKQVSFYWRLSKKSEVSGKRKSVQRMQYCPNIWVKYRCKMHEPSSIFVVVTEWALCIYPIPTSKLSDIKKIWDTASKITYFPTIVVCFAALEIWECQHKEDIK